jgi:hypothetical protein
MFFISAQTVTVTGDRPATGRGGGRMLRDAARRREGRLAD